MQVSYAYSLPLLRGVPVVNFLANLILGVAITLLNFSFELVAASIDERRNAYPFCCRLTNGPHREQLVEHLF